MKDYIMEKQLDPKLLSKFLTAFAVMAAMFFGLMGLWYLLLRLLIRD